MSEAATRGVCFFDMVRHEPYSMRLGVIGLLITGVLGFAILGVQSTDASFVFGPSLNALWFAVIPLGILSLAMCVKGWVFAGRCRRYEGRVCRRCGYDLRTHNRADSCPECGLTGERQKP